MAVADISSDGGTKRPFQFTIRQLISVMVVVCLIGAAYSWIRIVPELAELLVPVAMILSIALVIYMVTKWPLSQIVIATLTIGILGLLLLPPALSPHRTPSRRSQCSNHLKQIGLALQNYHDVFGSFPPAYIADANGKPMHSWRVLILPFMEHKNLYDSYNFNEPWNGPKNSKLAGNVPWCFVCPACSTEQSRTETNYVAVVGPQTMWPGERATRFSDLADGSSNTLMVVEVHGSGIHWMEPRDLHVVQMPLAVNPTRGQGISSPHKECALAVFADGHTAPLVNTIPPQTLEALLTIAGGETIGDY